jgi:hypothetical protein
MLSEGVNRQLQCRLLKIDEQDNFGLLAATAQYDTIGAVKLNTPHYEPPGNKILPGQPDRRFYHI